MIIVCTCRRIVSIITAIVIVIVIAIATAVLVQEILSHEWQSMLQCTWLDKEILSLDG